MSLAQANGDQHGKISAHSLEAKATDLLEIKRKVKENEKKEIKADLSNLLPEDSKEQVIFKIFEQTKSFNNKIAEMTKEQKETKKILEELEM